MLRTFVIAAAVVSIFAVAVLAAKSISNTDTASAATTVDIAIDMDITGNDARLTGFTDTATDIQNCGVIDSSGTNEIQIDVILPPLGLIDDDSDNAVYETDGIDNDGDTAIDEAGEGIDEDPVDGIDNDGDTAVDEDPGNGISPADGLRAYQFKLLYDPAVVHVTAEDTDFLLAAATGSFILPTSDATPDSDGTFFSAAIELGNPPGIEPAGIWETGPGVLARITLTGVGPGTSTLALSDVIPVDAAGLEIPANVLIDPDNGSIGTVSVDQPCVPLAPGPFVRIASLECTSVQVLGTREQVTITNFGSATQKLGPFDDDGDTLIDEDPIDDTDNDGDKLIDEDPIDGIWKLLSDPVGTEVFDLSSVHAPVSPTGVLEPGKSVFILSGPQASTADNDIGEFAWSETDKFRDVDASDFARIVDGDGNVIHQVNCGAPPKLTVIKKVINDNDGTSVASDFTLTVDSEPVVSGEKNEFLPGTKIVGEEDPGDYNQSWGGDCNASGLVDLDEGDDKTCILTNDDMTPEEIAAVRHGLGSTPTPTPKPLGAQDAPAPSLPGTGDSIPVEEGGGSVLPWLFVGLGAAIAVAATGYLIYGRTRSRPIR